MNDLHRGEIYYISRGGVSYGHEQQTDRPAVIVKQRDSWTVILEGFKEQFFKNRYTIGQQRFICENRELYEDMFETCMNGSNEEFKEKFFNLSRELNNHA